MPKTDLEQLGAQLRAARKAEGLTQEQLSDLSHVSTKHIANIEKGEMNPSFIILKALARALKLSLDSLVSPSLTEEEKACKQLATLYISCPAAARETLLNSTRSLANELTALVQHTEIE